MNSNDAKVQTNLTLPTSFCKPPIIFAKLFLHLRYGNNGKKGIDVQRGRQVLSGSVEIGVRWCHLGGSDGFRLRLDSSYFGGLGRCFCICDRWNDRNIFVKSKKIRDMEFIYFLGFMLVVGIVILGFMLNELRKERRSDSPRGAKA